MTDTTALDIKIAYLEQGLEETTLTVYKQQKEIETLQKQVSLLARKLNQALEGSGGGDSLLENQKPPHY